MCEDTGAFGQIFQSETLIVLSMFEQGPSLDIVKFYRQFGVQFVKSLHLATTLQKFCQNRLLVICEEKP